MDLSGFNILENDKYIFQNVNLFIEDSRYSFFGECLFSYKMVSFSNFSLLIGSFYNQII